MATNSNPWLTAKSYNVEKNKKNIKFKIIRNGHYEDIIVTIDNVDQTFSYISYSKIKSEKELDLKSETIIDYGSSASLVNFINYYISLKKILIF